MFQTNIARNRGYAMKTQCPMMYICQRELLYKSKDGAHDMSEIWREDLSFSLECFSYDKFHIQTGILSNEHSNLFQQKVISVCLFLRSVQNVTEYVNNWDMDTFNPCFCFFWALGRKVAYIS